MARDTRKVTLGALSTLPIFRGLRLYCLNSKQCCSTAQQTMPQHCDEQTTILFLFLGKKRIITGSQKTISTPTPSRLVRDQPAGCHFVTNTFTYKYPSTPSLYLQLHPHILHLSHHYPSKTRTFSNLIGFGDAGPVCVTEW